MKPPTFSVLIPDGESDFAVFVMHGFVDYPQVKLHVLSNQYWAPARFSRLCHKYIYKEFGTDPSERFKTAAEVARQNHIDVILPIEMEWISPYVGSNIMLTGQNVRLLFLEPKAPFIM